MSEYDCISGQPWQILCRVIKSEGSCPIHKVGDEVLITRSEVQGKICLSALCSMISKVYAMRHNARLSFLEDQCRATHACPDYLQPVVFELIRKKPDPT
jgi:uncharacterized repeat protein (TIGR04076 family)